MKKLLLIILLLWAGVAHSQTTGYFRYDTTKFQKNGGRNHVMIENLISVTDSTYKALVVGADGVIKKITYWPGGAGGGSGTVTSFSSGNFSPLFTTGVATSTTTPALSFSMSDAPTNTFLGRLGAGSGIYSFINIGLLDSTNNSLWHTEGWYQAQNALYIPRAGTASDGGGKIYGDLQIMDETYFKIYQQTLTGETGYRQADDLTSMVYTDMNNGSYNQVITAFNSVQLVSSNVTNNISLTLNGSSNNVAVTGNSNSKGILGSRWFTGKLPLNFAQIHDIDLTADSIRGEIADSVAGTIQSVVAGTNVTVDNTDPRNPVVSASGGGGGSAKAYAPLLVRNDSVYQRFNVLAYGAIPNDGIDDTAPIQACINACDAAGGGIVVIPSGVFTIAGARNVTTNSQLVIPTRAYTDTLRGRIIIQGEGASLTPNGGGLLLGASTPASKAGSILYSTIATGANGFAVIGTSGTPNAQTLEVRDLTILMKNNPSGTGPVVGGISWKNGANFIVDKVAISTDTAGYNSVPPQLDITGIETPDDGYGEIYSISNTQVAGMRSGYKAGEHVQFNNANALTCYYGLTLKQGAHISTAPRIGLQWCAIPIYVTGTCNIANFNLDAEWQQIGKWYDNVATIKDSANLASGQVFYTIIAAGTGIDNTKFSKSGGANIRTLTHAEGVASANILSIGSTVNSGTAKSILYLGTGGALRQSNANFAYDSTNVAVGIGTNTPSNPLEIYRPDPYIKLNTTTSGGQAGIVFSKQGTAKWQIQQDRAASGQADWSLYDQNAAKSIIYSFGGTLNLGGTASVDATAGLNINSSGNVKSLNTFTTGTNLIAGTNIGLGNSTIAAWSAGNAIQKGNNAIFFGNGVDMGITSNGYYDGSWKYSSTEAAASIVMDQGAFIFRTAASGSANTGLTWTNRININNAGRLEAPQYKLSALNTAPSSATDTGTTGEIKIDANYIYVCTATNTWVRAALATW